MIGQGEHDAVQRTIDEALASGQARGRTAGTVINNENVAKYAAAGVRFLFTSTAAWLSAGANEFVRRASGT